MKSQSLYTIPRFCGFLACLTLLFCGGSGAWAAESSQREVESIGTYYKLSSESLATLAERIAQLSGVQSDQINPDISIEDYIASLAPGDYALVLNEFVRGLSKEELTTLSSAPLSGFYKLYIDRMSAEQFASSFQKYLGELTTSYLTQQSDQNFTEYVIVNALSLSEQDYSDLYHDYIETLWNYYVSSASPEEWEIVFGDDGLDQSVTADQAVNDERYFDQIAAYIAQSDEESFIQRYQEYITETIGGLVSSDTPFEVEDAEQTSELPSPETESEETEEPVDSDSTTEVATENISIFTDFTLEESIQLIRQHVARVAKNHFLDEFKADLIRYTNIYTAEENQALLVVLPTISGFLEILQRELDLINSRNREKIASLGVLADKEFLDQLSIELQLVKDIPYPSRRLLKLAISKVLAQHNEANNGASVNLPSEQFQILSNEVNNLVLAYDKDGVKAGQDYVVAESNGSEDSSSSESIDNNGQLISWEFPGCGCEIEEENIIYGFYPSWSLPQPGDDPQKIDLRFYDRVAYFGLTIDEDGYIDKNNEDEFWTQGGPLNDFIQEAHIRNTRIDLALYAPHWHHWQLPQRDLAIANIIDKLSIPLQFGPVEKFAADFLVPIYPTYSETIGKNNMGDGVTLYFDQLVDPDTNQVRNLEGITNLVTQLADELNEAFEDDTPPINIMLDFDSRYSEEILRQLSQLILGTQANPNLYVSRVLVFLEQESYQSSEFLFETVRTVFKDDDSAAVLRKINPILIPAMNEAGNFSPLSRDLRDLRWTFGEAGGAAIWPIPIESNEGEQSISSLIESAFDEAMVSADRGVPWQQGIRTLYFPHRLLIIFLLSAFYLTSILVIAISVREPIGRGIMLATKIFGSLSFILYMLSAAFIDPYINIWRTVAFLLPLIPLLTGIIPMQSAIPAVKVNPSSNRFIDRQLKRQKSRAARTLKRKFRQGIWSTRNES